MASESQKNVSSLRFDAGEWSKIESKRDGVSIEDEFGEVILSHPFPPLVVLTIHVRFHTTDDVFEVSKIRGRRLLRPRPPSGLGTCIHVVCSEDLVLRWSVKTLGNMFSWGRRASPTLFCGGWGSPKRSKASPRAVFLCYHLPLSCWSR